jgi:lysozyme
MARKGKVAGSAAGGALALALGFLGYLEGFGPETAPGSGVYRSYVDIAGVVTICNGHTGSDVRVGMTATRSVCEDLAKKDLMIAFDADDKYLDHVEELPVHVRAAGALFTLNVGTEALRVSSFRRLLNQRRIYEACWSLMLWTKARVGPMGKLVTVTGLVNRRTFERKLCLGEKVP